MHTCPCCLHLPAVIISCAPCADIPRPASPSISFFILFVRCAQGHEYELKGPASQFTKDLPPAVVALDAHPDLDVEFSAGTDGCDVWEVSKDTQTLAIAFVAKDAPTTTWQGEQECACRDGLEH